MARQRHLYTFNGVRLELRFTYMYENRYTHVTHQYLPKVSWSKIPNPTGSWLFLINSSNLCHFWGFQVSYFNKLLLEIYSDEHQIWSV